MNVRDLSKEDILASLGLQPRRTMMDYLIPALGIFGAGVLVGAGVGLLFAPKAGHQLRTDLGERVRHMRGERGEAEVPAVETTPH